MQFVEFDHVCVAQFAACINLLIELRNPLFVIGDLLINFLQSLSCAIIFSSRLLYCFLQPNRCVINIVRNSKSDRGRQAKKHG